VTPVVDPMLALRESYASAAALQLKARTSILHQIEAFEPGWMTGGVHREICQHLEGVFTLVERGAADPANCAGGPRLILQTPPGIGKTLMSGVHLLSHGLGRHPDWQFIYATYNHDKACEVGRDTRSRMQDPRYPELFSGTVLDKGAQSMDYFLTTRGGKATFTGVGGTSLGRRAHVMVVDDPFGSEVEGRGELHQLNVLNWILSTARSRLHPFGALVVIHQRWHVKDAIGRLLELSAQNKSGDQWCDCRYPMVAEVDELWRKKGDSVHVERFSNAWCEKTRNSVSEWVWNAMYQQKPTVDSGTKFKREWFKLIPREKFPKNLNWFISTDFATTAGAGDHSVAQPFAIDEYDNLYFDDPYHAQVDPHVAHNATFDLYQRNNAKAIFVEKGGLWNTAKGEYRQQQERRRIYPRIVEFNRISSKGEHSSALASHMAAGKVYHIDSQFTRNVVIPQFMAFTGERGVREEDDIIDAQYLPLLSWLEIRRPSPLLELPTLDTTPAINQQIISGYGTPKKKSSSLPWTAGEEDGESDEDDLDLLP
jgi:hypothetical protein